MKKANGTGGKWRSGSDHPASASRPERHPRAVGPGRPPCAGGRPAVTATPARPRREAPGHAPVTTSCDHPPTTVRRCAHGAKSTGAAPPTWRGRTFRGESQEKPDGTALGIPIRENASGHATTPAGGGERGSSSTVRLGGGGARPGLARSRTIRDFSMVYPRAISSKPTRGLLGRMEGAYAHPRG
jgi:hypothetical protein